MSNKNVIDSMQFNYISIKFQLQEYCNLQMLIKFELHV